MNANILFYIIMGLTISIIVLILQLFKIYNATCFIVGFYTYKLIQKERKIIHDKTTKIE